MNGKIGALLILGIQLFVSACDSVPGPPPLTEVPPQLYGFTFSPEEVVFDEVVSPGDSVAHITLRMEAKLRPGEVPVDSVFYLIFPIVDPDHVLQQGTLAIEGTSVSGQTELVLSRGAVGLYSIRVLVVDKRGRLGNQLQGLFKFLAREGHPPVIEAVEGPDRVQRPASGQPPVLLKYVAIVSDPEGPENILRVVMRTSGGQEFEMLDDGGEGSNSGDEVAGDGRYTITVQLTSDVPPGTYVFYFQAFDREGLASDVVEKQTIVE